MTDPSIDRIDLYLDQVPRSAASVEHIGPFTLFIGPEGGWRYYGRPSLPHQRVITTADVQALLARQRELLVPEAIEGVADATPFLASACVGADMDVEELPLLVWQENVPTVVPDGVRIRRLSPDDEGVAASQAVANLAFARPGTQIDTAGPQARDELVATAEASSLAFLRARIGDGLSVLVVGEDDNGVVATGMHQPVNGVTEIVGVGTLPAMRRRGLAAAITAELVADAIRRGVSLCFLTAGSTEVARVYEKVGFRRIGTAIAANRPSDLDVP